MTNGVRIRSATVADAGVLAEVHLNTVLTAYAGIFPRHAPVPMLEALVAEWTAAFSNRAFRAFRAEGLESPVGTVAVRADLDVSGRGQLCRLHVLPQRWGQGLGSTLYEVAMLGLMSAGYKEASLWVLEGNSRARSFYERRGWSLVARSDAAVARSGHDRSQLPDCAASSSQAWCWRSC